MPRSSSRFLPDDSLKFRSIGAAALLTTFLSVPFSLGRLGAYWNQNEWAGASLLSAHVRIESAALAGGQTYKFELEVDNNVDFSSPLVADARTISIATPGSFDLALTQTFLKGLDLSATHARLKMTPIGVSETGSIVFSSVANNADTVTIFDGINTTVFTFAASGNGATGAAVDVATGATATDSANNLRTAINNNVNINVTAGGAATTVSVTNDNVTGGSITKSDADNDYTVTDFSGGAAASIQFWAYARPDPLFG